MSGQPGGDVVDRPVFFGLNGFDVVPAGQFAGLKASKLPSASASAASAAINAPMPGVANVSRVRAIGAIALARTP
ncbi:hypothetical protein MBRU_01960 [Mycolicibacterium brumae DSM 44177]|nr:hypothetical protein MBRU_01960 [Mycolicibacterium brumae DSM 44177]